MWCGVVVVICKAFDLNKILPINNHLVWTNNPNTSAIGKGSKWKKKNQMNPQGDQSGNEIQKNHLGISVDGNSQ